MNDSIQNKTANETFIINEIPYTTLEAAFIGLACAMVITLSLLGNALVVSVILKYKRLQNATNFILLSLAIADFTVSIFVMVPSMITDIKREWIFNRVFCKFYNSCDIFCCTASILHLLLVAVDRYVAIFKPLSYRTMVRKLRVFGMVIFIWLLSGVISFIPIFLEWNLIERDNAQRGDVVNNSESLTSGTKQLCALEANIPYAIVSSSLSFYIPFVLMSIVYVQIYIVARRQANAIAEIDLHTRRCSESLENNLNTTDIQTHKKHKQRRTKDTKAIKTLGIIMGIFIICWLPFFIMYIAGAFGYLVTYEIERIITWIGYVNSFINPIVYALTNRDFRKAYVSFLSPLKRFLLCCLSCKKIPFDSNRLGNGLAVASNRTHSRPSTHSDLNNEQNCLCCCCCLCCYKSNEPSNNTHTSQLKSIKGEQPVNNGVKFYCNDQEMVQLVPLKMDMNNNHESI